MSKFKIGEIVKIHTSSIGPKEPSALLWPIHSIDEYGLVNDLNAAEAINNGEIVLVVGNFIPKNDYVKPRLKGEIGTDEDITSTDPIVKVLYKENIYYINNSFIEKL